MTTVQNQGNQQLQPMIQAQPQAQPQIQPQVQPMYQPYCTAPIAPAVTSSPNYAGVNIQIFNPSVGVPNLNPNGNATVSQAMPGMAYPSNYYTQNYGNPPQIIAQGGQGGNAIVYNTPSNPNDANGAVKALNTDGYADSMEKASNDSNKANDTNKTDDKKKTEKRKIVELSDDYIMNLENYLNSKESEVRMMGAKEVVARLQEDDSRRDDPALTALINKMLQDPNQQIRFLALSMLDSRTCTGDDYTIGVLKRMQQSSSGYGQDAVQATNILLKMSGKVIEKEFEVKENSSKK